MSKYLNDRMFTNYIHQNLAIKEIYERLEWKQIELKTELAEHLDINKGIDYCFKTKHEAVVTVQERFRERKYGRYNDITFRYRRDHNPDKTRVASEFFKIQADFMVYGVIDCDKLNYSLAKRFIKFAVVNLKMLMDAFDRKEILIKESAAHQCQIDNGTLICPINYNRDGSSSFVPVDISLLMHTAISKDVIQMQEGYE